MIQISIDRQVYKRYKYTRIDIDRQGYMETAPDSVPTANRLSLWSNARADGRLGNPRPRSWIQTTKIQQEQQQSRQAGAEWSRPERKNLLAVVHSQLFPCKYVYN